MRPFELLGACPACGYTADGVTRPVNVSERCRAKATDQPLRCVHAGDQKEVAAWPATRYEKGGQAYRVVTQTVTHHFNVEVGRDADDNPIMENRERQEVVVNEAATLAGGPLTPPATIPHVHRTCRACGSSWPELLKE